MNNFELTMNTQLLSNVIHLLVLAGTAIFFIWKFAYRFYKRRKWNKEPEHDEFTLENEPGYKAWTPPSLCTEHFSSALALCDFMNAREDESIVSIQYNQGIYIVFYYKRSK